MVETVKLTRNLIPIVSETAHDKGFTFLFHNRRVLVTRQLKCFKEKLFLWLIQVFGRKRIDRSGTYKKTVTIF